jgi:endo-1,3(4)-beta-glucanase
MSDSENDQNSSVMSKESLIDDEALSALPRKSRVQADMTHTDESLTPPTNSWFSGFALQNEPQPGFPLPNSFLPTKNGFELGLPSVSSSSNAIIGPHGADVHISFKHATNYRIIRYDELTVTLGYFDERDTRLAEVTIASGSPYVYVAATAPVELQSREPLKPVQDIGGAYSIDSARGIFGLHSKKSPGGDGAIALDQSDRVSIFSSPDQSTSKSLYTHAENAITSGSVSYTRDNSEITTELRYKTANGKPTVLAQLPHQGAVKDWVGSYRSIYGDMPMSIGRTIAYATQTPQVRSSLDVASLSAAERTALVRQVKKDVSVDNAQLKDTYFGGKQLYKQAQLLQLSSSLGLENETKISRERLSRWLTSWFDNNTSETSFYYDEKAQGVVGEEPAFGSDTEFNDHHFHYGYFIYAAAILAEHDDAFIKEYRPQVDLLVADIANYNTDEKLPLRRNYDAYAGHSWASGTAPFKDGNNQESSSEAINAWTGAALWAEQTANKTLLLQSQWLLANELATRDTYWLEANVDNTYLAEYSAPIVAINWGGKREYSTFFSDEANAKLAIQLLPLNPTMQKHGPQLRTDQLKGTTRDAPFGDYIVMASPKPLELANLERFPDKFIDDGNSKSYMMAYILTNK